MTSQRTTSRIPPAIGVVLASPLYRGATLALFLSGLGFSAVAPQIARFLVEDLGGSLTAAGLFYLTNLTAPVAGYLVGRRSDRTGHRLGPFRACAVAGAAGWAAIGFSTELWMPFVISAIVLGFAGAATSQLFAAIHDELAANPTEAADEVVSYVRMALTLGWVVGPVVGALLAAQAGLRATLFVAAICTLAQIFPLGTVRDSRIPATATTLSLLPADDDARAHVPIRAMLPLLVFTGLYVLVYSGEPIKYAYLPIHMNDQGYPPALSGAIIGIQPLVELVLMPVAFLVARSTGILRLMVFGAAFGVAANLLFALSSSALGLFVGQLLTGGVWGVFAGLGIIVAQRLLPSAIATASAIFITAPAVSSALGGFAGGIGATALGLPLVFVVPGILGLIACLGLVLLDRRVQPRL